MAQLGSERLPDIVHPWAVSSDSNGGSRPIAQNLLPAKTLECVMFTVAPDRGARAELQPEGLSQVADLVSFYKQNASILREVRCLLQPVSAMDRHMDWRNCYLAV